MYLYIDNHILYVMWVSYSIRFIYRRRQPVFLYSFDTAGAKITVGYFIDRRTGSMTEWKILQTRDRVNFDSTIFFYMHVIDGVWNVPKLFTATNYRKLMYFAIGFCGKRLSKFRHVYTDITAKINFVYFCERIQFTQLYIQLFPHMHGKDTFLNDYTVAI